MNIEENNVAQVGAGVVMSTEPKGSNRLVNGLPALNS
jgi:hypothetical protein